MFTEIPLSALTEQALSAIRNSIMTGNRFSHFGPNGNQCLENAIADIDAELERRMKSDPCAGMREHRASADTTEADVLADKVEDLINEFGDDPKAALQCVSEWLSLRHHFKTHSKA